MNAIASVFIALAYFYGKFPSRTRWNGILRADAEAAL
jgi:hypothetical protein